MSTSRRASNKKQSLRALKAAVDSAAKKKTKKRKSREDSTYNPHNVGTGNGESALNILTDSAKTVVTQDGRKIPKKTSFQFASPVRELLDEKSQRHLKEKIKEAVPTHRPAIAIAWFDNGVPKVLETPGKTKLNYRGGAQGVGYSYVNRSPLTNLKDPKVRKEFFDLPESNALVPNPESIKVQSILLTRDRVANSQRKIRKNHGIRTISQANVMKRVETDTKDAGASKIAAAAGIAVGVKKHYGHANGHQFLATESQIPLNLTIVTCHSNGAYLAQLEYVLKYLVKESRAGVQFTTQAYCFEGTHIQEKIVATLEVPDHFTLTMTFDGQQLSPTDKSAKDYMCSLAQVLVEQYIKKEKKNVASPGKTIVATASNSPEIIFSRKANCEMLAQARRQSLQDEKECEEDLALSMTDENQKENINTSNREDAVQQPKATAPMSPPPTKPVQPFTPTASANVQPPVTPLTHTVIVKALMVPTSAADEDPIFPKTPKLDDNVPVLIPQVIESSPPKEIEKISGVAVNVSQSPVASSSALRAAASFLNKGNPDAQSISGTSMFRPKKRRKLDLDSVTIAAPTHSKVSGK